MGKMPRWMKVRDRMMPMRPSRANVPMRCHRAKVGDLDEQQSLEERIKAGDTAGWAAPVACRRGVGRGHSVPGVQWKLERARWRSVWHCAARMLLFQQVLICEGGEAGRSAVQEEQASEKAVRCRIDVRGQNRFAEKMRLGMESWSQVEWAMEVSLLGAGGLRRWQRRAKRRLGSARQRKVRKVWSR